MLTAGEEGRILECEVTATNRSGSTIAFNDSYKVKMGTPVPNGVPDVIITTGPPASSASVGSAGAQATTEDVQARAHAWLLEPRRSVVQDRMGYV